MFSFFANLFKPKPKRVLKRTHLQIMTKKELENVGRKHGIELDRRNHKSDLVDELFRHITKKK